MYNLDTEEGQMMSFLWDMLTEGEYADCETLAKQMLVDNPNNYEAISVLAIVYEKMADASKEGGDFENEKEFLQNALSQYLKILAINPKSVAETIKVEKIRKRLNPNSKNELNEDFLKKEIFLFKNKLRDFYLNKLANYPIQRWLKIGIFVVPIIILAIVGIILCNKYNKLADEVAKTPTESHITPPHLESNYEGPTNTILIENDNAKIQREENEMIAAQNQQTEEQQRQVTSPTLQDQGSNTRRSSLSRQPNYQNENNQIYNNNSQPKQVKAFKLPWTDIELKPAEDKTEKEEKKVEVPKEEQKSNSKEKETSKDTKKQVKTKSKSENLRNADAMLRKAVKEQDSGDYEAAKKYAREAKNLYNQEINSGNNSRRVQASIDTAQTILGEN